MFSSFYDAINGHPLSNRFSWRYLLRNTTHNKSINLQNAISGRKKCFNNGKLVTAIASCSCEPLEKFSLNPKYSETYVVFGQVNMITADHSGEVYDSNNPTK